MSRKWKMNLKEEDNGASGEVPEYGAIFMSNSSTRKECLRRQLFGLPIFQAEFVKQIKDGMMLFLFEFESRELHGVFQACSDGAINIEPNAFRSSGKQFPSQVKFTEMWRCMPLRESEFRDAICENYFTAKKFNFGLSKAQVQRLLKLFSLKKVDGSRQIKTAGAKTTSTSESNWGNAAGDRRFGNRYAAETDGDVDREFSFRFTSVGDLLGCRLTENYGFGDESDIGLEYDSTKRSKYSGDTSGICRRLDDPKMHGSKDIVVGYHFSVNNGSGTDVLTNYSNYSVVNDRRVPKNLRHTASGWLDNEYHEKDGVAHAQASSWSNHKKRLNFKAEPVAPAQSSVPLESPYGTSREYYDPCEPGIVGDVTMNSSRHDLGAHNVDLMGSASYTANSNYVLRENIISDGGYVSDTLPLETVQPFPGEHNGATMNNTSSLGLDYYIPMPIEHLEHQTDTGMTGVACSESEYESESRNGHFRRSQFPDILTSQGATENMNNFERLSYPSRSIFPSFANPLSSRDLSPDDGVNSKTSAYQHQEKFGGQASYSNDRAVQGSRIYPSFTYPSTSGYGADMYLENTSQNEVQAYHRHEEFGSNEVQAYHRHEEFGSDAFDSNNRVIPMEGYISPAEHERKRTRKSVFSRLAIPSKEHDAEKDTSPDTESVDEVMAFLSDCRKHWMEQQKPNKSIPEGFGNQKKKKMHTAEVLGNDLMLPYSETSPDDLLDCDGSMEHSPQKLPFIDFKRRSKAQKSCGNPTQECKDSPEPSAPQNKKRKLLRPKLIEDDSEKNRGNNDNPLENVLASQSGTEVPVHETSLDVVINNHSNGVEVVKDEQGLFLQ